MSDGRQDVLIRPCDQADETIQHLLISCVFAHHVWFDSFSENRSLWYEWVPYLVATFIEVG